LGYISCFKDNFQIKKKGFLMKFNSGLICAILIFILTSCNKKTVQIPVLNVTGIQDTIYDNSQIWIFHELKGGDTIATLNRKNSIATTSWIFNIDKKLPMHLVIPHLEKLIAKREKPALHQKGEDDFNYFSYVDSSANLLSMVEFDVIYFYADKTFDNDQFANDKFKKHLVLDYKEHQLLVNGSPVVLDSLNTYFDNLSTHKKINVHLNFDKSINYQNYLELKARLQNATKIVLDTVEYIY